MTNDKIINGALALIMAVTALMPLGAAGQNIRGDFNMDGTVDVADVTASIQFLLSGELSCPEPQRDTIIVEGVPIVTVLVEGGTFITPVAPGMSARTVTMPDFHIGVTEVTVGMWNAIMGPTHRASKAPDNVPLFDITWDDAKNFIARINELTGLNFRLPTDDEWLFAALGGNCSMYHMYAGSDDPNQVGWWSADNNEVTPKPVATKLPNELGIYDMSGNVAELLAETEREDYEVEPFSVHGIRYYYRGGSLEDTECPLNRLDTKMVHDDDYLQTLPRVGFRLVR
jgi:formylglycine-generating enzyme required for sulfatase activity